MQDRSRDVSWRTGLNANDNQCSIAEVRGTKSAVVKLWPEPAKERLAAWPVSPTTRNSSSRLDYRCACRNGVAPQIILKECRSWTFDACSKPIISFLPPRKYFGVFGSQLAELLEIPLIIYESIYYHTARNWPVRFSLYNRRCDSKTSWSL